MENVTEFHITCDYNNSAGKIFDMNLKTGYLEYNTNQEKNIAFIVILDTNLQLYIASARFKTFCPPFSKFPK